MSAGMGQYGAVGFSYGGAEGSGSEEGYSGSEGGSGEDEESEAEEPGGEGEEADGLAANLCIDSFSVLLRRAEREEEAEATGAANANRKCACPLGHHLGTMGIKCQAIWCPDEGTMIMQATCKTGSAQCSYSVMVISSWYCRLARLHAQKR